MEKKVIHQFYHEHELILTEKVSSKEALDCYGCGDPISNLESAYVCAQQPRCSSSSSILHKRCAELPRQLFSHPSHPQHLLHLFDYRNLSYICNLCRDDLGNELGYQCRSCDFDIHITCGEAAGMDELIKERRELQHQSHLHPLTLMRKPAFSFTCDGCGTQDVDMAYICSTCEYWLHKACASLPILLPTNRHRHHHELSLAFCFPMEHRHPYYRYACDVCDKYFDMSCWLYICDNCRYFVHLQCIDVTQLPLHVHDISKKLITPFVMREKGLVKIPTIKDMPAAVMDMPKTTASFSFLFNYHKHRLSLISEDDEKIMDEEVEDDELKICDVCVTRIYSPPYYECAACKYFVHPICYLLPKTLSTSSFDSPHLYGYCPNTHNKRHKFTLYTSSESSDMNEELYTCELCRDPTNGMVYECKGCETKIDVKCASLPTTIRHGSHSHHNRLIMTRITQQPGGRKKECHGCQGDDFNFAYCCNIDGCDFALDLKCALLPQSIVKHAWDKHPLLLRFDVSPDHPSDFICEFCEEEMHPKQWMYHCRQCDYYFHIHCFRTASGWYRNIKFGRGFVLDGIHRHPLTFNCVTLKKICDICHEDVYNCYGLECTSCNYVVCLRCGRNELAKKM